jgi:hypothetical protein
MRISHSLRVVSFVHSFIQKLLSSKKYLNPFAFYSILSLETLWGLLFMNGVYSLNAGISLFLICLSFSVNTFENVVLLGEKNHKGLFLFFISWACVYFFLFWIHWVLRQVKPLNKSQLAMWGRVLKPTAFNWLLLFNDLSLSLAGAWDSSCSYEHCHYGLPPAHLTHQYVSFNVDLLKSELHTVFESLLG